MVHLQRHYRAAKESHNYDDQQTAHADHVHLEKDIVGVVRAAKNVAERPAGQHAEFLNREDGFFQQIQQVRSVPVIRCYHN